MAISLRLALSNLLGTVFANLTGGVMIDLFGPLSSIGVTLVLALVNCFWFAFKVPTRPIPFLTLHSDITPVRTASSGSLQKTICPSTLALSSGSVAALNAR